MGIQPTSKEIPKMYPINLTFYNCPAPLPPMVSIPLMGVTDVRILKTELNDEGEFIITVESTLENTVCHKCGHEATKGHGHDEAIVARHLSVFGLKTYIHLRPKRFRCEHCTGKAAITTQQVSWRAPQSRHTQVYEEHVLLQLVNSTVEDVSHKEGLGYDAVLGILDQYIAIRVNWAEFEQVGVLGLDEIALKKGHRDYVVIVTARLDDDRVKVLAVLPNREKDTVIEFLNSIPENLQKTIHTVCTDMYANYIDAVELVLPHAKVVVDRFHVAKKYRGCADKLRIKELKRLKDELPEKVYKKLKGVMWAFRKKEADLTERDVELLDRLFALAPQLKLAYEFREKLTAIFEQDLTKEKATEKIEIWRREVENSELTCFKSFLITLDNYLDKITNYFINRDSSGFVEGLNNKIKVLKRQDQSAQTALLWHFQYWPYLPTAFP
jgi:transposase